MLTWSSALTAPPGADLVQAHTDRFSCRCIGAGTKPSGTAIAMGPSGASAAHAMPSGAVSARARTNATRGRDTVRFDTERSSRIRHRDSDGGQLSIAWSVDRDRRRVTTSPESARAQTRCLLLRRETHERVAREYVDR